MERITSKELMDKLDMFQDIFGKIDRFGWWDLEIFIRCRYAVYLHGFTGIMSNLWSSDYVSSSVESRN